MSNSGNADAGSLIFGVGTHELGGHTEHEQSTVGDPYHGVGGDTVVTDPATHSGQSDNAITRLIRDTVATHTRSSTRLIISALPLIGTLGTSPQQGPVKFIDRQIGRRFVILKCPASNSKGCYVSHSESGIQSTGFAWLLSPTDPQLVIETEAEIWVVAQTGVTATDFLQAIVGIDALDR